jgi:hypothetical protein
MVPHVPINTNIVLTDCICCYNFLVEEVMSKAEISIDNLTVIQKLNLMERLWVDLSRNPSDVPSPEWHGDVLVKRRQLVEKAEIEFVDWSDAKKRLQHRYE